MGFNRFLYKRTLVIVLSYAICSCNNSNAGDKTVNDTTNIIYKSKVADSAKATSHPSGIDTSDFVIEYIVIADTSKSYYKLRAEMFKLNKVLNWEIDTMDRFYNTKKDKIVLSDTAGDEIYRGEYLERRLPSENMSLEYYTSYNHTSTIKNIALVCGIYRGKKGADSLFSILKLHTPTAFVQCSKMFIGCEH